MVKRNLTRKKKALVPDLVSPSDFEWAPAFLAVLRDTCNVRASCLAARISRQAAYIHRDKDKVFRKEWADAMEDGIDKLELIARWRAVLGSDLLTIFLLKAHRPEVYRETTRHEVTGKDGEALEFTIHIDKANENGA